jgi:hypothetical protein
MKTAMIALLAFACSSSAWAGGFFNDIPGVALPDSGSSMLLLGMGVAVVGLVRRSFRQ